MRLAFLALLLTAIGCSQAALGGAGSRSSSGQAAASASGSSAGTSSDSSGASDSGPGTVLDASVDSNGDSGVSLNSDSSAASRPSPAQIERALAIAGEYKSYGRVDDELRWAPFLCRQPLPGIARQSMSNDPTTHGQKLYSVFVRDYAGYPEPSNPGQVVVKESFHADVVTDPDASFAPAASGAPTDGGDHFYPFAMSNGKLYRAGLPAGLFIMYRDAPGVPDTDDGWTYATVSPASEVTASGRIDSCIGCHLLAPHGRLFGVPKFHVGP